MIDASATVQVEYVGDPNPLDHVMKMRIVMGEIPESAANVIRGAAIKRCKTIKGVNIRIVDPEHFGTSKEYRFGPSSFVLDVDKPDYEKMKQSTSGHQFRRVGDPVNNLILPRDGEEGITLVKTEEFNEQQSVELVEQSLKRRR